jgi:hypothetical protein
MPSPPPSPDSDIGGGEGAAHLTGEDEVTDTAGGLIAGLAVAGAVGVLALGCAVRKFLARGGSTSGNSGSVTRSGSTQGIAVIKMGTVDQLSAAPANHMPAVTMDASCTPPRASQPAVRSPLAALPHANGGGGIVYTPLGKTSNLHV